MHRKIVYLGLHFVGTVFCWSHVSPIEFQKAVKENELTLVAFVAPWTEQCKSLELEWKSATTKAAKPLISIDCIENSEVCEENQVISYPAIRVFKNGENVGRYRGVRKSSEIVEFVSRAASQPVVSTVNKKNLTSFKSIDQAVFIANPKSKDIGLAAAFRTLATSNSDRFTFGIALPGSGVEGDIPADCIICYKAQTGEEKTICRESKLDVLENFMETAAAPLIGEMTRRNELKYLKAGKSLVYIFGLTEKERSTYGALLTPLAKTYEEYLNFVTINALEYSEMTLGLGLEEGIFPALAVQNPILGQVFPFDQRREITLGDVEEFILNIVQGKVQPAVVGAKQKVSEEHSEL